MGNKPVSLEGVDCTILGKLNAMGIECIHATGKGNDMGEFLGTLIKDYRLIYCVAGSLLQRGDDARRFLLFVYRDDKHFHTVLTELSDTNLTQGDSGEDIIKKVAKGKSIIGSEYCLCQSDLRGWIAIVGPRYIREYHMNYERRVGGIHMSVTVSFDWPGYHAKPLDLLCHDRRDWLPVGNTLSAAIDNVKTFHDEECNP